MAETPPGERSIGTRCLMSRLYESATAIPAWQDFVDAAQRHLGVTSCAIFVSSLIDNTVSGQISSARSHDDVYSQFAHYISRITHAQEDAFIDELSSTLFLTSAIEGKHRLSLMIEARNMDSEMLRSLAAEILPLRDHLSPNLRIFCRYAEVIRREKSSEIALSTSRIGIALVARSGELMLSNTVADTILNQVDGLRISHGRIRAANATDTKLLMAEVERCASDQAPIHDPALYKPLAFTRSSTATPLTIIVRPGPAFHPLIHPLRRSALLVIRDPVALSTNNAATLVQLFGLTTAEAGVTRELAKGASLEDVAAHLGTSRNTVRSQLQSIFHKIGVNRQSDLVRIVLNSGASST